MREKNMNYVVYPTLISFYCMKRNSHFNLLFWQTKKACQSLDTSGKGSDILNTKKTTLATQQHLEGHYPAEDIIHKAKKRRKKECLLGNIGIVLKFQPFVRTA